MAASTVETPRRQAQTGTDTKPTLKGPLFLPDRDDSLEYLVFTFYSTWLFFLKNSTVAICLIAREESKIGTRKSFRPSQEREEREERERRSARVVLTGTAGQWNRVYCFSGRYSRCYSRCYSMVWYFVIVWYGTYGMVWYGVVCGNGMVWYLPSCLPIPLIIV